MKVKQPNFLKLCGPFILGVRLLLLEQPASAIELPPPQQLINQQVTPPLGIEVVEPHESSLNTEKRVVYLGFPMESLLTQWFKDQWRSPDVEVVFSSRDGYHSVIDGQKFQSHRAYLAFARQDGHPFVIDNPRQNETGVPLGPYYLIWDNRENPALRQGAEYGWPYQVMRIELAASASYQAIAPPNPSEPVREGLEHFKQYCLTCHRIGGVGGEKYPADLRQRLCTLDAATLKNWIESPGEMRGGVTPMPPLNVMLPESQRSQITDRIVLYLRALEAAKPVCPP